MIKRRRLGRTELMVTELGFGAMNLRQTGSFEAAGRLLDHVIERGINIIDTARGYNGEVGGRLMESEVLVGEAVARVKNPAEPIIVITKGHGYTPEDLKTDLAVSLSKLGVTGRRDLRIGKNPVRLIYFLHGISTERWETISSSGVLDDLKKIREDGLVSFVGFSSHYPFAKEVKEAADTGAFDVIELPYNVFNRSFGEDGPLDLLKYFYDKDIGVVNMKAFDGNGTKAVYPVLSEYMDISYGDMLNFCLSNPYISTVDAGATDISQIDDDIRVGASERFNAEKLAKLKKEADKVSPHMSETCRECTHCNEKFNCPRKINFMDVLSVYSRYKLSKSLGRDVSGFAGQYKKLALRGKDCAGCGECLPWCEYRLDIPKLMKEAETELGV